MIELKNIHKRYIMKDRVVTALADVNLHVNKGEIYGIIGHSGAGKSTLLRCVNLLETPTEGAVAINGQFLTGLSESQLQNRRKQIGMIFQHFNLLTTATVRDNIAFPLRIAKQSKRRIAERVDELLELVGLTEQQNQYPRQLSGGQKQRVGIARALANHPEVLLCDEATSALDPQSTDSILGLLRDINTKLGITILLITHEMNVIRAICDRVAVMDAGRIVEEGSVLDVFLSPQQPMTRQFVSEVSESAEAVSFGQRSGKVVKINFRGDMTYEPVLFEAVRATGASFAILQGTVSKMKDTPYGQLVVELRGTEAEQNEVISVLLAKGLDVSVLP